MKLTRENALKIMGRRKIIAGLKQLSKEGFFSPSIELKVVFTCAAVEG